ncbi:MAG: helix-turn-helix domain-containing protein, partial [Planctomycetota bacterium]
STLNSCTMQDRPSQQDDAEQGGDAVLLAELEQLLRSTELELGLGLVLKTYALGWPGSGDQQSGIGWRCAHKAAPCKRAKALDQEACNRDCRFGLPDRCADLQEPGLGRCYAGIVEMLVPVRDTDGLAAVLSLGPLPERLGLGRRQRLLQRARLLRGYLRDWQRRYARARAAAGNDFSQRLLAAIDRHLSTGARLADVAHALHCSPTWASRHTSAVFGCSFTELRDRRRLQLACERLRDTEHSIEAIARSCGFPHPTYFYSVFKRRYACRPGEWREQARRQDLA